MKLGKIYLIPVAIADNTQDKLLTPQLEEVLKNTKNFIVEHTREARRFISSLKLGIDISELEFEELNKHQQQDNIAKLLEPAKKGNNIGIMSDAGCPGVADPGALVVREAHRAGLEVVPLVGPSSILLALMSSGMSGQNFRFNGYLPIDRKELKAKLQELEAHSRKHNETQIFIETPYRSDKMFNELIHGLQKNTELAVSINVTGSDENIQTRTVGDWQKAKLIIGKRPTVFLFLA
jgi:16S rRNA (cytidine1402-2'-O)-methyltransferase